MYNEKAKKSYKLKTIMDAVFSQRLHHVYGMGFRRTSETVIVYRLSSVKLSERVSIECRKTKTKVITLANQKGRRQSSKPIKTRSNYT